MICTAHPILFGSSNREFWNGMGKQCIMGERRGLYRVLVGKPEEKGPLARPRRKWDDDIKMDLQEVGFGDMDWIELDQDRDKWRELANAVMKLWVP
jgi:hypothetical protein